MKTSTIRTLLSFAMKSSRQSGQQRYLIAIGPCYEPRHVAATRFPRARCHPVVLHVSIAAHAFTLDDGQELHKTCSIGFASYRPQDSAGQLAWHDTVSMADQCLYVAKSSGRDLWVGVVVHTAPLAREGGAGPDLRAGVQAGAIQLRWGEGRQIVWPETGPAGAPS